MIEIPIMLEFLQERVCYWREREREREREWMYTNALIEKRFEVGIVREYVIER